MNPSGRKDSQLEPESMLLPVSQATLWSPKSKNLYLEEAERSHLHLPTLSNSLRKAIIAKEKICRFNSTRIKNHKQNIFLKYDTVNILSIFDNNLRSLSHLSNWIKTKHWEVIIQNWVWDIHVSSSPTSEWWRKYWAFAFVLYGQHFTRGLI